MSHKKPMNKHDMEKQISEHKVLQAELSSLKKNAKVYRQQPNSSLCFLSTVDKEMAKSKGVLDSLISEYKSLAPEEQTSDTGRDKKS